MHTNLPSFRALGNRDLLLVGYKNGWQFARLCTIIAVTNLSSSFVSGIRLVRVLPVALQRAAMCGQVSFLCQYDFTNNVPNSLERFFFPLKTHF